MNVETITMDPVEVRRMLREYRQQIGRAANAEYEAVELGLAAIARGRAVINLTQAILGGGFDERERPRLAVARADRKQIRFSWWGTHSFFDMHTVESERPRRGPQPANDFCRIQAGRRPAAAALNGGDVEAFAMVPMVPPRALREARLRGTTALGRLRILWEVDQWHDRQRGVLPSRDPYLIRRLGGDLYEVLAQWDLTPLERTVIAGTRR